MSPSYQDVGSNVQSLPNYFSMAKRLKIERTPALIKGVMDVIGAGNTIGAACIHAGISEDTLMRWRKADPDLNAQIYKAENAVEVRNVAIIQQAAAKSWQAAAWWLERRRSVEWRQKQTVEHEFAKLTDEELIARAKVLLGGSVKAGN